MTRIFNKQKKTQLYVDHENGYNLLLYKIYTSNTLISVDVYLFCKSPLFYIIILSEGLFYLWVTSHRVDHTCSMLTMSGASIRWRSSWECSTDVNHKIHSCHMRIDLKSSICPPSHIADYWETWSDDWNIQDPQSLWQQCHSISYPQHSRKASFSVRCITFLNFSY